MAYSIDELLAVCVIAQLSRRYLTTSCRASIHIAEERCTTEVVAERFGDFHYGGRRILFYVEAGHYVFRSAPTKPVPCDVS